MASLNKKVKSEPVYTHEGGKARRISSMQELRRSVLACMLWENEFYEEGEGIADRIVSLIQDMPKDKLDDVAALAVEARSKQNLRHVPLLICNALVSVGYPVANTLAEVIQRPDELSEFMAIYWKDGKTPIAKQVKKGLAKAFTKFNAYSLAKYNQDREIKLRDVLFMVHAKPKDQEQAALWKQLVDDRLPTPDTWEVELSASKDKKASWTRLVKEGKLGGLATLRNLRNMQEVGVESDLIKQAIENANYSRVLPFRFIAADRYAPQFESSLERALLARLKEYKKLEGTTVILVDVSGSMEQAISSKSDMRRLDAACGLAMVLSEVCDNLRVLTFSSQLVEVAARRGFALRDAIFSSQAHRGTYLGMAVSRLGSTIQYDRLIVITDEQSADSVPTVSGKNYMLNVASNKNGIGYGEWTHIDGFSEACVDYIIEKESKEEL